jgi:hypothetical protein
MKPYTYGDGVFTFEGAVSVAYADGYAQPWRADYRLEKLIPYLQIKQCAGVRLCFTTDAEAAELHIAAYEHPRRLDIYADGRLIDTVTVEPGQQWVPLGSLGRGEKAVEVWFDQQAPFQIAAVSVAGSATVCKTMDCRKRWVHYGSSISQSAFQCTPSKLWTARVARETNLHLTNLAFSGNCKLDPMICETMAGLSADLFIFKLGINLWYGDLTRRTFLPGIIGLIRRVREKHPATPIVLISPIYCPTREVVPSGPGHLTLVEMREIVKEAAGLFRGLGDENIYYLDGLQLLRKDQAGCLRDGLHPDAEGQSFIAENFIREMTPWLPA